MSKKERPLTESQIEKRRDEAVRRALATPPKPYKESKVGKDGASPSQSSNRKS